MNWQPIESAPKDGTYILVSNPAAGGSWVAHWFPVAVSGYKFDQPWRSVMLNHWHIPEKTRYVPPTHWMPLPPPPKDKPIWDQLAEIGASDPQAWDVIKDKP